jgi:hypothetical protein
MGKPILAPGLMRPYSHDRTPSGHQAHRDRPTGHPQRLPQAMIRRAAFREIVMSDTISGRLGALYYLALILIGIWFWVEHVARCMANDAIGFLVLGLCAAPVGWIHGAGIAFDLW